MIWQIQINSGVNKLNDSCEVFSHVTMFYNDTKLEIIWSFKITKLVGKYDKQQIKIISMTQASVILIGTVLFLKLAKHTAVFYFLFILQVLYSLAYIFQDLKI